MEPTLAPTFETLAAAARVWLHRHVAELRERFPGARFYPRDLRDHAVDTRAVDAAIAADSALREPGGLAAFLGRNPDLMAVSHGFRDGDEYSLSDLIIKSIAKRVLAMIEPDVEAAVARDWDGYGLDEVLAAAALVLEQLKRYAEPGHGHRGRTQEYALRLEAAMRGDDGAALRNSLKACYRWVSRGLNEHDHRAFPALTIHEAADATRWLLDSRNQAALDAALARRAGIAPGPDPA